jgi:hypothetical protein
MNSPAFIVEGYTEKIFLSRACPGSPVKRLEINGKAVLLTAIVDRIESISKFFYGRYRPIVVVFDREGRKESADAIAASVATELTRRRPTDQYAVGVADRMIENWILADWERLRESIGALPAPPNRVEGSNGKAMLRRLLAERGYSATIDGPALLKRARPSVIENYSASFGFLRKQLHFDCWWLGS